MITRAASTASSASAPETEAEASAEGEEVVETGEKEPWYASGLKFGCTQCGKCCTGKGGIVRVNEQEILKLSEAKGMTYQEFGRKYLRWDKEEERFHLKDRPDREEGACVFLEGKTCSVYSARPMQCRTFPFWPRFLESKEGMCSCVRLCVLVKCCVSHRLISFFVMCGV